VDHSRADHLTSTLQRTHVWRDRYELYRVSAASQETQVYSGVDRTFADSGLMPYTLYSYYVVATNGAGATASPAASMVPIRTLESAPTGMTAPFVTPLGATRANVSWSVPTAPNGVVTSYTLRGRAVLIGQPSLAPAVFYTGLSQSVVVDQLSAESTYEFNVEVANSVGSAIGPFASVTTCSLPPREQPEPTGTATSPTNISLLWQPPAVTNGAAITYKLLVEVAGTRRARALETMHVGVVRRGGAVVCSDFTSQPSCPSPDCVWNAGTCVASAASTTLAPGTTSSAGSTTVAASTTAAVTTTAPPTTAAPTTVAPTTAPTAAPTSAGPSGAVAGAGSYTYVGTDTRFMLTGLAANTRYTVVVLSCNTGSTCTDAYACAASTAVAVTTNTGVPQGVRRPTAQALSSTEVEVTWTVPTLPNGVITSYSVFRNQSEVYSGTALRYVDDAVFASTTYSYVVVARTSAGSGTSPSTVVVTPSTGSPYDLGAPTVEILSDSVLRACWAQPRNAGQNVQYLLSIDGGSPTTADVQPSRLCTLIDNLAPFSLHSIRVVACNGATACATSPATSVRTECAAPSTVTPQVTVEGTTVRLVWSPPASPNCNTTAFTVQYTLGAGTVTSVDAGTRTSLTVTGLLHSSVYVPLISLSLPSV
jgi:usherin